MKPARIINQGESFVTLRATTDRPSEIREALDARDVQHVFKGDQNQAWDAVLANHCLARALNGAAAEPPDTRLTFFIQDERLGTSDARLRRHWAASGRRYVLTEDYYRGRAGAVWEHQDCSYGLFFTETVSPEQFAAAGVHLHRAAILFERHAPAILADGRTLRALASLGVTFPGIGPDLPADGATRLGPACHPEVYGALFAEQPAAAFYYAFTRTEGLYGLAPVENDNRILSSIPAADPEVLAAGRRLLVRLAGRGALRQAVRPAHRRAVLERIRRLADWSGEFLRRHPDASLADFQDGLGRWLTREIFPADRLVLDRASRLNRLPSGAAAGDEEGLHSFLELALRRPAEFTAAYNEALNRVGFGLQRMRWEPETGRYTPPYFVELPPAGAGTPVYRFTMEISGKDASTLTLQNPALGDRTFESSRPIRSVAALAEVLRREFGPDAEIVVVGKAAAFAAELQRPPRGLGLPRQGSKYAPMVDHLLAGLRERGVLDRPHGLLIRIGLNALDRLSALGETPLRLPAFLCGVLGRQVTCRELARRWREVAGEADALLRLLSHCHVGQHVHLVKAICLNANAEDWDRALSTDRRLAALLGQLRERAPEPDLLFRLGADTPPEAVAEMRRLTGLREELLAARREERRLDAARERRREEIECRLLLLFAAVVRRLRQRAESLPYLNDRPYTLGLYLLFGPEVFAPICREVEFDIEYLSPCPVARETGAAEPVALCAGGEGPREGGGADSPCR